ncbi:MAG: hypothetical protein IT374_19055 [Polyangiaceae bacterium]|nr:hypothetical protein [Polyangiaceae bacterium]
MSGGPPAARLGRIVATAALVGGGVLLLATLRATWSGERALAQADQAIRAGDGGRAIAEAGRAARAYVPGAPHVPAAYLRLVHVARTSEVALDRERALLAWREVRQAALDTRWLAQPHARELAMANDAIARLSADDPRAPRARDTPGDEITARTRALLERDPATRRPAIAALLAGLLLGTLGAAGALAAARAGRPMKTAAIAAVAGFVAYAVAVAWL